MHITVLGAGLVGSAIIKDLAADYQITAVDFNPKLLEAFKNTPNVKTIEANLREDGKIAAVVADADLVISAVPGFMGFETLKQIIIAGKNVVDIAFFPEDAFELDTLAKENNVTAIVDCGVAPGSCNVIAGFVETQLDSIDSYLCYVGGLPRVRQWPYEYKAVFSPIDVLEEYLRPARFVEYGREVVRPALTDIELIDFPGVGTLEAFNTDGLRSLISTLDAPFKKEKTLRYPGHANLMRIFRESGFFNNQEVDVKGTKIRPLELTSQLIFDHWQMEEGEEDFTVMQVVLAGTLNGVRKEYTFYMLDYYDTENKITSMARTTGYTATIIARQVLNDLFTQKGIIPPEYIGRTPGCYENMISEFEKRDIMVSVEIK